MILVLLTIITTLFIVIGVKCNVKHELIALILFALSAVIGMILLGLSIVAIIIKVPYFREQKKIDFEQRYQSIMFCIEHENFGTTSLASDIAEYNSEILRGRMNQNSAWFSVITYDFYEELTLIEL